MTKSKALATAAEALRTFSVKNTSKRKTNISGPLFLSSQQQQFVLEWYSIIFELFCKQDEVAFTQEEVTRFKGVEFLALQSDEGFNDCGDALSKFFGARIDLLIADVDYGARKEGADWDTQPWGAAQFSSAVGLVNCHNGSLETAKFCFFVTDQQLPDLFQVLSKFELSWKLCTWVKNNQPIMGRRFQQNTEHFVFAWKGNEAQLVDNIAAEDDRFRYSTHHLQGRILPTRKFNTTSGKKVNPYQKPLKLMQKIINMACKPKSKSAPTNIVDVTCGTGTTAVGEN